MLLNAVKGNEPPETFPELSSNPDFSDRVFNKANKFNTDTHCKVGDNVEEVRILKEL